MRLEKSCGAVVFAKINNEIKFLIEEMNEGHFAFPKGRVENDETELETAKREIKEETGLDVMFLVSFKETTHYYPIDNVEKKVIYFLAEAKCTSDLKVQKDEVREIYFLNYDEASKALTYENDRDVLKEALEYLTSMK